MNDDMRPPGRFSEAMKEVINDPDLPYALVWFNGTRVPMEQRQYEQAVRDGALCRCRDCLACRTYQHHKETT